MIAFFYLKTMELNIRNWNEITDHLNGYVLERVEIRGSNLMAINSNGEAVLIATRTPIFWAASYGKSFEAVEMILRNTADELKAEKIYDSSEKDKTLLRNLEQIIQLHTKGYKS